MELDAIAMFKAVADTLRNIDPNISVVTNITAHRPRGEQEDETSVDVLARALYNFYHYLPTWYESEARDAPLVMGKGRGDQEAFGTLRNPNVGKLLMASVPAFFGLGDKTVYDESVRLARCIPGHNLQWQANLYGDLQNTAKMLNCGNDVRLKISKLHIYQAGGHFQAHRDTLQNHDHVGTIVVLLGSEFTGGEFVIDGQECPLEVTQRDKVPFVAFHTDTLHEVRPVTSGVRITLQVDVFRTEYYESLGDDSNLLDFFTTTERPETPLFFNGDVDKCRAVVDAIAPHLVPIIIPTYHKYTQYALHSKRLKGLDVMLLSMFEEKFNVTPVPLNVNSASNYDADSMDYRGALFWKPPYTNELAPQNTWMLLMPHMSGVELFSQEWIAFTGNQAQEEAFVYYFSGFLITNK